MERRLGRGLGSLLSGSDPAPEASDASASRLPLKKIRPNPHQPRTVFDEAALDELRQSLEAHGLLQPIVVRPRADGYEIVSGERRWRAARLAGWQDIPATVRETSDDEMLELALVENVQRADLDPLERARGYRRMMEELGLTQEAVATRVGLQRSSVTNHLRLLELPDPLQQAIANGLLSMGHAKALLGLPDADAQVALMETTVRDGLSVREVERRVRGFRSGPATPSGAEAPEKLPPWARDLETRLRERFGTKVRVEPGPKDRGRIVLEYHDRKTLDRLFAELLPGRTV